MNGKIPGIIAVAIILAGGGWYFFAGNSAVYLPKSDDATGQTPNDAVFDTSTDTAGSSLNPATETSAVAVTITYSDSGFSPKTVSIKQGQTVTWVNASSEGMWVASAAHPTHMVYDDTNLQQHCTANAIVPFDACKALAPGAKYSFTFTKVGTWGYHNHVGASKTGSVTVAAQTNTAQ